MPKELQTAVSEKVLALTEGDRLFQRAEPVSRSQVESSVADVVRAVNEAAEASKEDVQRFNIQLAQRFVNEEISYEEFERDLKQEIRTVRAHAQCHGEASAPRGLHQTGCQHCRHIFGIG